MELDKKSQKKKDIANVKENTIRGTTKMLLTFIMMGSCVNI